MEFINDLWVMMQPTLLIAISTLLTALLGYLTAFLPRGLRLYFEKNHRDALHNAVMSGVESAMKHGFETGAGTFATHVETHVRRSVPDAIKYLAPSPEVLKTIIERYIGQAKAQRAISVS